MRKPADISRIKAFYFLYFAAAASFLPYLALIYEQRGLSGRYIGILTSVPPVVTLFASPFWTGIADAHGKHRQVMLLTIAGAAISSAGIYLGASFWPIMAAVIVFALFNAPIIPMADDAAMKSLKGHDHLYGSMRIWGAVGWGIAAPTVGILVRQGGLVWPWLGFFVLLGLGGLATPRGSDIERHQKRDFLENLMKLVRSPGWILFMTVVFIAGIGSSIIHNYLFLYMNYVGSGPVLMGLALTVATLSEVLVFGFSDRIMKSLGPEKMLFVAVFVLPIRLIAYSMVSGPWMILIVQSLHGITFSLLWVAGVAMAGRKAPSGTESTSQGLFSGNVMGLAASVGAMSGGWIYEVAGPIMMFRWISLTTVVLAGLAGLLWRMKSAAKQ